MTVTISLPPEPVVTAPDAAELLGVHRNTILNMAKDGRIHTAGKLPGRRGAWLFTATEVERVRAVLDVTA